MAGIASFPAVGHVLGPGISANVPLTDVSLSIRTQESTHGAVPQLRYPLQSPPAIEVAYQKYAGQKQPASAPESPGYGMGWDQADVAVAEYQVKHMPHFPFVLIEPGVGAQELFSEKPFLYRVVMLITTRQSAERRKEMRRKVMAYLGHHLLVQEERDLDLLQGLLVFIAW